MDKVAEDMVGELLVAAVRFAGDDDDFSSGLDVAVSIADGVLVEHNVDLGLDVVSARKEGDNNWMCSFRECQKWFEN